MGTKKAILFLVEGESDQEALTTTLEKVFSPQHIKTVVEYGDITSDMKDRDKNIHIKVTDFVNKKVLTPPSIYKAKDFISICLITDLDGCFVDDAHVVTHESRQKFYDRQYIYHNSVEKRIATKNFKAKNLRILSKKENLIFNKKKVPFFCYYMSCNLEDVFLEEQNCPDSEKENCACEIATRYENNIEDFIRFLNDQNFTNCQNYHESWKYPQIENRSLERHTNFLIFLLDHKNYLSDEALKICNELQKEKE